MIPVFKPIISKSDKNSVLKALARGEISGTFGKSIIDLERNFSKYIGTRYAVSTSSGSTALHLSIAALELKEGSEIIVSSTTNIASALAITHNRCIPVPIDSNKNHWNIDCKIIEKSITKKTKAIIVVHFLGNPADMIKINKIAKKYKIHVIEDAAEAHGAEINKKKVGSFGISGCFSFYANKVITSGEGGIITTNNKKYYEKLKLYRNLGFTTPRFVHFIQGFNFRMTNLQAAVGVAQMEQLPEFVQKKQYIGEFYKSNLKGVGDIEFQHIKNDVEHNNWLFTIQTTKQKELLQYLNSNKILSRPFWMPMNQLPMYIDCHYINEIDNCRKIHDTCLSIPCSTGITDEDLDLVVEKIKFFFK